jgi:hypothetical protein
LGASALGLSVAGTAAATADGQGIVPATPVERKGYQPIVKLTVRGGVRTDAAVGKPVTFSAVVELPPGTGKIVAADWDFEGTGCELL